MRETASAWVSKKMRMNGRLGKWMVVWTDG